MLLDLARPVLTNVIAASNDSALGDASSSACTDINQCRTVSTIVWNCISLVFLCTWVSIHPNIPEHGRRDDFVLLDQVYTLYVALIFPEIMVLWAFRQWTAARELYERFRRYDGWNLTCTGYDGWTMTHAFFVAMGGFAIYDGPEYKFSLTGYEGDWFEQEGGIGLAVEIQKGRKLDTVTDKEEFEIAAQAIQETYSCLLELLLARRFLDVSEQEITDRSHTDVITKAIAVVQTMWFIFQYIARGAQGLTITELETIALGYAVLNFALSFAWFSKPLRVRYALRINYRAQDPLMPEHGPYYRGTLQALYYCPSSALKAAFNDLWKAVRGWLWIPIRVVCAPVPNAAMELLLAREFSEFPRHPRSRNSRNWYGSGFLFSSGLKSDRPGLYTATYGTAVVFGCVHCILWSSSFPNETERILWRVSALSLAVTPAMMAYGHWSVLLRDTAEYWKNMNAWQLHIWDPERYPERHPWTTPLEELGTSGRAEPRWVAIRMLGRISIMIAPTLYVGARIITIVLAFIQLADLPPTTYREVQWTNFIPHIG